MFVLIFAAKKNDMPQTLNDLHLVPEDLSIENGLVVHKNKALKGIMARCLSDGDDLKTPGVDWHYLEHGGFSFAYLGGGRTTVPDPIEIVMQFY